MLEAHSRLTLAAAEMPPDAQTEFVRRIDQARNVLIGLEDTLRPSPLDRLASPRGMAVLTAAGAAFTAAPQIASATSGLVGLLAPIVFVLGVAISVKRRAWWVSAALALALLLSAGLELRRVADPGSRSFQYGGDILSSSSPRSPFAGESFVPLTLDPATGLVDETVIDPAEFTVSCVRVGAFKHHEGISWAYITAGDYETYWVPVDYLGAMSPGASRKLVGCSNWRWLLQNLGSP